MKSIKAKLLAGALIAAMLAPAAAAGAQTRDLRHDRQEVREDRRDVRQDQRELRRDQRDLRDARQEQRQDWRSYRAQHREMYRAPAFRAPFRYQRFGVNSRIDARYWGTSYRVSNVARWRLPPAGHGQVYVRHYNDLLLVNTRTGRVAAVYQNFYW